MKGRLFTYGGCHASVARRPVSHATRSRSRGAVARQERRDVAGRGDARNRTQSGRLSAMDFSRSFYEVAAQLIPVTFLAMVVEERLHPDAEETAGDRVLRSWLLAAARRR